MRDHGLLTDAVIRPIICTRSSEVYHSHLFLNCYHYYYYFSELNLEVVNCGTVIEYGHLEDMGYQTEPLKFIYMHLTTDWDQ